MKTSLELPRIMRRRFLVALMTAMTGVGIAAPASAQVHPAKQDTVRDRLWIFTCAANSDYPHIGRRSVMTPVEGAFYLGVPNIIVVQSSEKEAPYGRLEPPFAQYAIAMRPLKLVVWSVVGSGGFSSPKETEEILKLAKTTPNFAGVMLDDFFTGKKEGKRAKWTVDKLAETRRRLKQSGEKLEVFATLYHDQNELPIKDYLDLIDVVTVWGFDPEKLVNLEANLERAERLAPKAKKIALTGDPCPEDIVNKPFLC